MALSSRRWLVTGVGAVMAVLAVAAAVPFFMRVAENSRQQTDRDHLRRMWEGYLIFSAQGTGTPRSRGYRFWLSLFAGDPEGGTRPRVFFVPDDAGLLSSPNDPVADPAVAELYIRNVEWGDLNAGHLTAAHTSYAGPRESVFANPKTIANKIVGATGSRDGIGFYPGYTIVIHGNLLTEIRPYATPTDHEPDWHSPAYAHIANLGVELPLQDRRWITWPYEIGVGVNAPDADADAAAQPQPQSQSQTQPMNSAQSNPQSHD